MKVGWLVENAAPFVYEEVGELRQRGVDIAVASVFRPWGSVDWSEAYAGPVYYPEPGRGGWLWRLLRNAARQPAALARVTRSARQDRAPYRLVALAGELAVRARREHWNHVHGTFASFPAWVAWAVAELRGIPFSLTGHAYDVQEPRPWLPRILDECTFARAISTETADRLKDLARNRNARAKVHVSHLGVDTDRFRPVGERRRRGVPRILCVANQVPEKGITDLLDATRQLVSEGHAFRVELVGEGPLTPELRCQAADLGLLPDRVVFRGRGTREQVRRALARASIFVLPCSAGGGADHDGLPVAILEAMACGLPVVSTPVGGIPDAIDDTVNGCLTRPDDPSGLARTIAGLLSEPQRRYRMGAAARRTAEDRFSSTSAARRLQVLLDGADAAPSPTGVR